MITGAVRWAVGRWPVLAQVAGGLAVLAGVWCYLGIGATLIIGGVALVGVGTLREARVI